MSTLHKHMSGKVNLFKVLADDVRLSYRAVGVFTFLMGRKNGWDVTTASLARGERDETADVVAACNELLDAGYMTRRLRSDGKWETHISDEPRPAWVNRNALKEFESPVKAKVSREEQMMALASGSDASPGEEVELVALGTLSADTKAGLTESARMVMEAWVHATDRDPARVKLTSSRLYAVGKRIEEGYGLDDLIDAVRGVALSSFHMGDNDRRKKYDDMELILRNGQNVEKFRDLYREGGEEPVSAVDRAAEALDEMGLGDW